MADSTERRLRAAKYSSVQRKMKAGIRTERRNYKHRFECSKTKSSADLINETLGWKLLLRSNLEDPKADDHCERIDAPYTGLQDNEN